MVMAACTEDPNRESEMLRSGDYTLHAAFDNTSRTYVAEDYHLRWTKGDKLSVFWGNTYNQEYLFEGETGANSGDFNPVSVDDNTLQTGNDLGAIFAVYPYNSTITIRDGAADSPISMTLPAEQSYAENSFGLGANPMVAVTASMEDHFLSFKHLCGFVKISLYGLTTVRRITLQGNNNEPLAGAITVKASHTEMPTLTFADEAFEKVLTLDCGTDGVQLNDDATKPTVFWFVVPPTTFEAGITLTVENTDGMLFEKSSTQSLSVLRGTPQPMAALKVVPVFPKNQIYYFAGGQKNVINLEEGTTSIDVNNFLPIQITVDDNGTITPSGENLDDRTAVTSVVLPAGITEVGDAAFAFCSNLERVLMPPTVTKIGMGAFGACTNLKTVELPDGVTEISTFAFGMSGLESITLPESLKTIGISAFSQTPLKSIVIPDSVVGTLGNDAFAGCTQLSEVTIGKGLTEIFHGAFSDCTALEHIEIPANIVQIQENVFEGCTALKHVTFAPESKLLYIWNYSFKGCTALETITLPASLGEREPISGQAQGLGGGVFDDCPKLKTIYSLSTVPIDVDQSSDNAYPVANEGFVLYVPTEEARTAYLAYHKGESGWYPYNQELSTTTYTESLSAAAVQVGTPPTTDAN